MAEWSTASINALASWIHVKSGGGLFAVPFPSDSKPSK